MKPTRNLLLLLLLAVKVGVGNSKLIDSRQLNISMPPNIGSNQRPKTSKDSTHLSDFTPPYTGLNPFLDLQEGRTGAFGRRFKDQDRPLPMPYLPPFTDVVEGESDSGRAGVGNDGRMPDGKTRFTSNPRWRSWPSPPTGRGDYNREPINEDNPRIGGTYPKARFDFDRFAETTLAEEISTETIQLETTTTTSLATTLEITGASEFSDVDTVTSTPENPFSNSVTMSALIIGSVVFVLALIIPFAWKCLRNRRRGRISQQHATYGETITESRNCENNDYSANGRDSKERT